MAVCLLEVPTVQDDGVVSVFWVQRFLELKATLEFLEKDHQTLEGRHLSFDHQIAPEIQELQEDITWESLGTFTAQ